MSPGGVGGQVAGWPGGIRVNQMLIRLLNPLTLWVGELMIGINDTIKITTQQTEQLGNLSKTF